MKTIQEFKAEQAAAIIRHEKMLSRAEHFDKNGLPIPGYIADSKTHGAIHFGYWNRDNKRTMGEAVSMFAQFVNAKTVIPFHVLKDGSFTALHPELRMPAKKNNMNPYKRDSYKNAGYAAKIAVTLNAETRHTTAKIEFFAIVSDELYSIAIDFGSDYIGACHKLSPKIIEERGHANRVVSRKFSANNDAHALSDVFISYSYGGDHGPIATGCDHRFLFVSDTDENEPVECSHALGQLENLSAIVDKNI
jgi:hypothetical protein